MRRNPGRRTRIARVAVIVCAIIVAAVGAAAAALRSSSPHPSALPHPTCGSAITHFLTGHTQLLSADPAALSCFVKAARQCRSASLGVTEMGVDTGTDYLFAIKPGGTSCKFTELSQYYSANFGGSRSKVSTVQCRRNAVTRAGVELRCAGRDVLIPSKVSVPSPRSA
jgi:hypothetical protein